MTRRPNTPFQTGADSELYFGAFRLEGNKQLWKGAQLLSVRPRPLAVLRYLAERSGQLVTSDELLEQLWPGIYVTRTVLRVCVRELRFALHDDPITPQFIETVGRYGYRFLPPFVSTAPRVIRSQVSSVRADKEESKPLQLRTENGQRATSFVGREQELARLRELFERARRGERQTVFLFGEAGIGKTTVVERFLDSVQGDGPVRIGRGQCIEHYGLGEAYLPLLEALRQLCQEPNGGPVVAMLHRHAPLWLAQLPGLVEAGEREAVPAHTQSGGQDRMLGELVALLEALAVDTMLVVVLEDLQWSDVSTINALAYLAQRRSPAQLCLLGTYRSADVAVSGQPLRPIVQDLYGRRLCEELSLELLTEAEVEAYIRQRFAQSAAVSPLSQLIYRRTDGNALFMVSFVDYLLQQGGLTQVGGHVQLTAELSTLRRRIPKNLQQVVLQQLEGLTADEQKLLHVASVDGMSFTSAAVAGVVGARVEDVEAGYDRLASEERLVMVTELEEWPEGAVTVRYEFRHAIYQQVIYEQLGQARRVRLHRQVGEWKEKHYGESREELVGELAVHFTEGRDYPRAVLYHQRAGVKALRRSAYQEAEAHCAQGLELLMQLPNTSERQRQELTVRMLLSTTLTVTQGFVAEELIRNLTRARELCQLLTDDTMLASVLVGLGRSYYMRADRDNIEQLMEEERQLLERIQEPKLSLQLHTQLSTSSMIRGALVQAQQHHTRVLELYNPQWHQDLVLHFGLDPAVVANVISGWSLWLAGWPDQARSLGTQGLSRARELGHPFSLIHAFNDTARVQLWCGNLDEAEQRAEEGVRLAHEYSVAWFIRAGEALLGAIRTQRGEDELSLSMLRERTSQYRSAGALFLLPVHLAAMAEAYRRLGRIDEGLAAVAEALQVTETSASVFWAAEVHRLKGELLLQSSVQGRGSRVKKSPNSKVQSSKSAKTKSQIFNPQFQEEAEACFLKAIETASKQQAKSLELRAVMSLVRLRQQQATQSLSRITQHASRIKLDEAHMMLSKIYNWFTEGFDTADLQEAKAVLEALGR